MKLQTGFEDGLCARETRYVKAACLPPGPFPDEMECTISGYGVTEKGVASLAFSLSLSHLKNQQHLLTPYCKLFFLEDEGGSSQLLDTKVLLINQSRCMAPNVLGEGLDESMLCAGRMQGGIDTCQVCFC